MTTYNKLIFSFLIAIVMIGSFASCVREYDPGFDDHVPKLNVNAVISPDTTITFGVYLSRSTVDTNDVERLRGAIIDLYEDGQKIETITEAVIQDSFLVYYDIGEERWEYYESVSYTSTTEPIVGKNYRIEVNKSGYETAIAETHIPMQTPAVNPETDGLRLEEVDSGGGFTEKSIEGNLYVDIDDVAGEKNFYEFALYVTYIDSLFEYDEINQELIFDQLISARQKISVEVSNSTTTSASDNFGFDAPVSQFSDVRFDGQRTRFSFRNIEAYIPTNDFELELEVRFVSEEYYNYFTSYDKYNYNQGNFLAEPVIVFNNIENGYGVFAGYNLVVFPVEF